MLQARASLVETLPSKPGPWHARRVAADAGAFAEAPYRDLFERSTATAFQHPVWMDGFVRHVAPGRNAAPHLVSVADAEGRLVAALALITRRFSGAVLLEAADLGVSDYCAPVIDAALADDPLQVAALARAMAAALPAHDIVRFRNIRGTDRAFFEALAGAHARSEAFSAHATPLAQSMDEWRATALTPSFAKYLARRVRKVQALPGARLRGIDDPVEAAATVHALAALRKGRFDGDMIARSEVETFYAGVASDGTAQGFARVHVLEVDGRIAGATLGVRHGGSHCYLLIGCDYAAHGALSPGLVLYDFAIAEWIAAGGTSFDFTIGDEPFKMDFGTVAQPIHAIEKGVSLVGRAALIARDLGKAVKGRMKP
jgi:CelD/BcsL family acetyltransferase involved in cellulose biosynthesis